MRKRKRSFKYNTVGVHVFSTIICWRHFYKEKTVSIRVTSFVCLYTSMCWPSLSFFFFSHNDDEQSNSIDSGKRSTYTRLFAELSSSSFFRVRFILFFIPEIILSMNVWYERKQMIWPRLIGLFHHLHRISTLYARTCATWCSFFFA